MSFLMVLYRIYQALIAVPLLLVVTIIAAVLLARLHLGSHFLLADFRQSEGFGAR